MKYFTQRTTKKNYGKLYRFLIIAMLVMCGGMVMGQTNTWKPQSSTSATYILRSNGTGNNFDVYRANGNGTTLVGSNYTHIYGRVNFAPDTEVTIIFENERTILFNGQFDFNGDGSSLTLQLGNISANAGNPNIAHSADNPTLKIIGNNGYNNQKVAFFLRPTSSNNVSDRQLIIQGHNPTGSETYPTSYDFANNFVIDGDGPTLTIDTTNIGTPMSPYVTATSTGTIKDYGLFRLQQGSLTLKNVTVQNFSTSWSNGGMAQVFTNNATAGVDLLFEHCYFTNIGASSSSGSPVLRMQGGGGTNANRNAILKNCKIENSFGSRELAVGQTVAINNANATIRTLGNNKVPLTIEGCHLAHNYGCPVRWHGCGSSQKMTVKDCLIKNNFTWVETNVNGGGGLLLKGPAQIQNCTIRNNRTNGSGGGIYLSTYTDFNSGTPDLIPEHSILKLDSQTKIYGNIAQQNGGGVAIEAKRMNIPNPLWYTPDTYLYYTGGYIYWTANPDGSPNEPFRVEFQQNGGKIYDNTANGGYGGGVFINREDQCTYYGVVCKLDYGEITGNTAANGGGVAIVTTDNDHVHNPDNIPTNVYPQDVIVEVSGASLNQQMLIQGNTANANGGGIYLEAYPIEYNGVTSTVTTTVLDYSNIHNNTATTSGGGLYVERGTVSILKNNDNGTPKPTISKNTATNGNGGGVYLNNGVVRIKGAVIGSSTPTNGNAAQNGGGIFVNTGDVNINYWRRDDNVATSYVQQYESAPTEIKNNVATVSGGGIYTSAGIVRAVGKVENHVNQKIEINNNIAQNGSGGGVFCMGGTDATTTYVKLDNVQLIANAVQGSSANQGSNVTSGCGGGIYLQKGKIEITKCDLQQNTAYVNGGGINNHEGSIEVSGCLIGGYDDDNNISLGNVAGTAQTAKSGRGGGIYTNAGDITVTDCKRGSQIYESKISYNTAYYNGGGLNTHQGTVTVTGGHDAANRIEMSHNVATTGSGGGIFCRGTNLNTEYITLTHVDVTNNQALGTGGTVDNDGAMPGCGGGMYLQLGKIHITDVNLQGNHANYNGGGINNHSGEIDVDGCAIGGGAGLGNSAGNSGGGIYTNAGNIDIEDYIDNSVYGSILHCESKITHNTAVENGGGVDTRSGTIYVNRLQRRDHQIEISHNTAKKGGGVYANQGQIYTYNAFIDNNTASENGGGLNNHSGDICIYGGSLSNNTAETGHGGGAYTNVGDIDIWPFNPDGLGMTNLTLNDGTQMFNNIALYNGGGVNNHTGRVDVRYATIQNNTATRGNGGGIYCEGPRTEAIGFTVRLTASLLNQNKTRGADGTEEAPTGRGGGLYLKYGRIFAQGTDFTSNMANINGGGINNHEGNIRVYGCNLSGNSATEGDGGGIYAHQGDIFIGPCGLKGSSSITSNTAKQNGGGIFNHEGNISINGDYINQNQATNGNGGGIYVNLGDINMMGGQINNNTATKGKGGGIYMGGTVKGNGSTIPDGDGFTISERVGHTPIVQVLDVEVGSTTAKVHYHVVDDGDQNSFTYTTHGYILDGDGENPVTDTVGNATSGDTEVGDVPGCRKHNITGLTAGSTHTIKAWATYTNGSTTVGPVYSPEVSFTTYPSNAPVVIIGAGTNITQTTAEVNAKVIFDGTTEGTDAITYRGICYSTGDDPTAATKVYDARVNTASPYFNHQFYTITLSGLTAGTTYNAWAFATIANSQTDFVYSAAHSTFTTTANIPQVTTTSATAGNYDPTSLKSSATFVGTATSPAGQGLGITEYGFVWSTDDDPSIVDDPKVTFTGAPSGSFTQTIDTLKPGTNYYARAYAKNSQGTSYGAAIGFVTKNASTVPVVRSTRISDITQHTAKVTNKVVYTGNNHVTIYGICWNTTGSPTVSDSYTPLDPQELTAITADNTEYNCTMTGLRASTTYYVRAFASNDNGTTYAYGNNYNFTTLASNRPRVEVDVTTTPTQANIQCKVFYNGDDVNQFYIVWGQGTEGEPGYESHQENYTGTIPSGDFTHTFTITPSQKDADYWVYAYAKNNKGEFTGRKVNFRSGYAKPTVSAPVISNITFNPATGHQLATATATVNKGDNNTKAYGFVFGSSQYPTLDRESQEDDSDIRHTRIEGDFSSTTLDFTHTLGSRQLDGGTDAASTDLSVNALYSNRLYYVRAYATSKTGTDLTDDDYTYYPEEGTGYTPVQFLTLPNIYARGTSQVTNSSAMLNAEITSKDSRHYLRKKGFVWSTNSNDPLNYDASNTTTQYVVDITSGVATTQTVAHQLPGLTGGQTYYWRAFVINQNNNIAYTATSNFTTKQFAVTAVPKPLAAASVSGGGYYNNDDQITLTATATNSNYVFVEWKKNGTAITGGNSITETVTADASYEAYFKVYINAQSNNTTYGTVSVPTGDHYFTFGQTCTMTANPNAGYNFVHWTKDDEEVGTETSLIITVNDAAGDMGGTYTAVFEPNNNGGGSKAASASPSTLQGAPGTTALPRDIYPAPAREPWDWDDDILDCHAPLAMTETTDTIVPTRATTTAPVNKPSINNNSAEYGGGVYVEHNQSNPAKIVFAGGSTPQTTGTINNNTATEAGGGIYISQGASMQMKGHCQVNSNHVPTGKKGGGIYLDGTLLVGNQASDPTNAHALQVNLNWIGDGAYTDATRNNVYLPTDPILTGDALHKMRVITLLSDISGKTGTQYNSKIGLSVDRGFREVIYSEKDEHVSPGVASDKKWLEKLMPETGSLTLNSAIFEDSQQYYALHVTPSDDLFDEDYIYLWSCWTSIVAKDPNTSASPFYVADDTHYEKDENNVWHIKTNYGLAWFSSIINGLNNQTADPTAKAVIENDLDMSAYFWVPLGSVSGSTGSGTEIAFTDGGSYQGTFNGQGHVIKGLICTYMTGIKKYGLFGTVNNNAIVKNTFVDDYRFSTYWQKSGSTLVETGYRMGGIAAETEGNAVISNCEARGTMKTPYCTANETYVGGLVGLMKGTNEVHSSMAMPEVSGKAQKVGGLVGQVNANNMLKNSFANVKLGAIANTVNVGGLVGDNLGTVENCYARLQNTYDNNAPTNFYWFAGANIGTITYCYAPVRTDCSFAYVPSGVTAPTGHGNYTATQRFSGKYGFKHRDHQMRAVVDNDAIYITDKTNDTLIGGLQHALNGWVKTANTPATPNPGSKEGEPATEPKYSTWTRTMATPINDDYPILEFADFNAVGSEDSIYMLYNTDVNTMITAFNAVDATMHPTPSVYLYDENPTTLNVTNRDNVMLAINEDIGILQSVPLKARVGVTIRNSRKGEDDQTRDPNWHLFSSAINKVPMGIVYDYTGDPTYNGLIPNKPSLTHDLWSDRTRFDPPKTQWYQSDNSDNAATYDPNSVGYFPTNTPYGTWRNIPASEGFFDLYAYDEFYYHWINFKRAGKEGYRDHWHMDRDVVDGNHYLIKYTNEEKMPQGKGYLMALSSESMMMADGTLNTGSFTTDVTCTPVGTNLPPNGHGTGAYDEPWRTLNLVGNPYQSYLDFKELVANSDNAHLLYNENGYYCYATRDDDTYEYIYYTTHASENYVGASQFIHPHQGFFVKVNSGGKLHFTDNMRVADKVSAFRGEDLNYPLVNLLCYEASGKRNYTTVEINRPRVGGGLKMKNLKTGKALIYARFDDNDFQTLFAPVGVNTVPVRFETEEDGTFTLRWSKYHGDFSYLHLIDNLTGADIDCLTTDEYRFEAKTTDYVSRFKLVFNCTGIDEPEVPEPVEGPTVFAFLMGDELIVNGEGTLQLFDMNGRCLMTTQAVGQQSSVSLPKVSAGIYLLRLTGDKQVKVQKMVIK